MRLISVTVEDFRTLRGTTTVAFGEGLNVVHAPNETGKSTLFEAIQTVLTLKAKATGAPLARITSEPGGGTPAVTLNFEHADHHCTLHKRFAKASGSTTLELRSAAGTATLNNLEAEARLRELLQVDEPGRGAPKPEQLGIWPLLWSKQTATDLSPTAGMSPAARGTLSQKLSALTGTVLAGQGGDALVDAAAAEHKRYFTNTGNPAAGGPLKQAVDAAAEAEAEATKLDQAEARHAETTRQYAGLAVEVARIEAARPGLTDEARRTADAAREAEAAHQKVEFALQQLKITAQQKKIADDRVVERTAARRRLQTLEAEAEAATKAAADATRIADKHRAGGAALNAADTRATADLTEHATRLRAANQHLNHLRRQAEAQRLTTALTQAERFDTLRREARRAADAQPLNPRVVSQLEALTRQADDTALELRAAAATVHIEPLAGPVTLNIDETADTVDATRQIPATAPLRIELPNQLRITVTPGGDEIADRREAAAEAERALATALAEADVTDARTAAQRVAAAGRYAAEAKEHAARVAAHAPDGIDALRNRLANLDVTPETAADATDEPRAQAHLEALQAGEPALREAEQTARLRLKTHRDTAQELEQRRGLTDAHAQRAAGDRDAHARSLDTAVGETGPDAELAAAAQAAAAEHDDAEAAARSARQTAEAAPIDLARDTAARAKRTLESLDVEAARVREKQIRLEAELQRSDLLGLDDRAAAARVAHDRAQQTLVAETRRAHAARTLATTLTAARETARAAHVAPLREEALQLLRLIFPHAEPDFDESFDLIRITRPAATVGAPARSHPFNDLSAGAQEQVGLVLRLALAKVLAGDDTLPLLLDDALVATDDTRFDLTARVLDRCAPPLQIILATCDWPRHRVLGLPPENVIDLAALRA